MTEPADLWRVVIPDVQTMRRMRAVMVLGTSDLTYAEAIEFVSNGRRRFESGPMTQRQAERVARAARRHGAEPTVERLFPG